MTVRPNRHEAIILDDGRFAHLHERIREIATRMPQASEDDLNEEILRLLFALGINCTTSANMISDEDLDRQTAIDRFCLDAQDNVILDEGNA